MGITRGLVKSVFSRNRYARTHENNARSSLADKKRWSAVRSYLCGDEFNSVLAKEDSASVKSSEATVTQPPLNDDDLDKGANQTEETTEELPKEKHNSTSLFFHQEDAAIIIQSAFRTFLARQHNEDNKLKDNQQVLAVETKSPSRDSVGTSIEVQTGNSTEVLSVTEGNMAVQCQRHKKPRVQILKLKEEWDDSTVSSTISKMRLQNRLEATNRRERALAYAFAQQLRICSKKKQTRSDDAEPNMSWSWLERWMATRMPECSIESRTGNQLEPTNCNNSPSVQKKFFDVAVEEKESCGSNEISVQYDSLSQTSANASVGFKPSRNRVNVLKATRTISRRKTVPSHQCPKEHAKVVKKECSNVMELKREFNPNRSCNKREIESRDASTETPLKAICGNICQPRTCNL